MRILHFDILNDKAVRSWTHEANGDHVAIAGDPGTGKTTAASALWDIASKSPDCLTHGAVKGHIKLALGDGKPELIAEREFTPKTSKVKIRRVDGESVSAAEFKTMLSRLSEDPHRIAEMKPNERVETLLAAADLHGADLPALDAEIARLEDERLLAYRMAERLKPGPAPEMVEAVSVSELLNELEAIRGHNEEVQAIRRGADNADQTIENLLKEQKKLIDALERNKQEVAQLTEERNKAMRALADMKPEDETPVRERLESAEATNRKAAAFAAWAEKHSEMEEWAAKRQKADAKVRELRAAKAKALTEADWPLEGLSVDGTDILYHDVLFVNLGESERMLVCAALALKDILAHPLKVVRMDGVESMGQRDFEKLRDLFGDAGVQVISTRVSRGHAEDGELVIEEGGEA